MLAQVVDADDVEIGRRASNARNSANTHREAFQPREVAMMVFLCVEAKRKAIHPSAEIRSWEIDINL